jgi:Tfp pilus assembly protein PilO
MSSSSSFTPRQVDLVAALACLGLTVAGYLLVFVPAQELRQARAALESRVEDASRELAAEQEHLRSMEVHLERIREARAQSRIELRNVRSLNARLADLVEAGSRVGLEILETGAAEPDRHEWYLTVPIELRAEGTYSQGAAFLDVVHGSLPDVELVAFDMSGNTKEAGAPASLVFNFVWYAALPGADAG